MAPPLRSKPLKKDAFPSVFKPLKPLLFSESLTSSTSRPSQLVPNIRSLSWSPAGTQIATCTSANIRVWSPDRASVKSSLEVRGGHNGSFAGGPGGSAASVEKVAFCPTMESVLASTGADGGVRMWDVRMPGGAAGAGKGTALADCKVGDLGLFLAWHPHGTELLVGVRDDGVKAIDIRRMAHADGLASNWSLGATDCFTSKDRSTYTAMAFSNSGREVFACTRDGPVRILDYPSMTTLHSLVGHTSATSAVQHSPQGTWVAAGGSDSMLTLWDTTTWLCGHALPGHTTPVRDLSFSFDGAYLIASSGSEAKEGGAGMEVYHVDTGDVAHTIDTVNPVTVAAWHPSRYWVAYSGDPGGMKIVGAGSSV